MENELSSNEESKKEWLIQQFFGIKILDPKLYVTTTGELKEWPKNKWTDHLWRVSEGDYINRYDPFFSDFPFEKLLSLYQQILEANEEYRKRTKGAASQTRDNEIPGVPELRKSINGSRAHPWKGSLSKPSVRTGEWGRPL